MHLPNHSSRTRKTRTGVTPSYKYSLALLFGALASPALATASTENLSDQQAGFFGLVPSEDTHLVADWIMRSGDNQGMAFIVIDKVNPNNILPS